MGQFCDFQEKFNGFYRETVKHQLSKINSLVILSEKTYFFYTR